MNFAKSEMPTRARSKPQAEKRVSILQASVPPCLCGNLDLGPSKFAARARYLYPASPLRCQYRGHIIRVRSENAELLVNAGIIIKTLSQLLYVRW